MYTRKIYEPESKFSLQIARNPGASVRSGAKGTGKSIERSSAKWTIDTSGEEEIQQRRKNGSGQLSQISPYKAKESVLDEDIQNLFRVDTGILEHHVKNYVSDYSRWYSESMQEIGNMGWSERYSSSDSLDKGAADFSDRSEIIRMYLDVNKDKLNPEYYTAVTDFLTQQKDCTAELQENHKQKRSLLTRFDDQESYDAFLSELAERERLLRLDTEELQREIDQRESDLEEYEVYRDQYVIASNNPDAFSQEDYERIMSGYNALKSKYGSPESMQSDTERLRYEHSTAVRLQNRVLLPGEAMKAPDYEELSGYLPVGVPLPEDASATYFYNLINGRISDPGPMAPKGKNLLSDYDKLTPDEIAVFNYNYNSGNAEAAMDYLLSLEETLNYRKAEAAFSDYEGRTGKEILYGVDAGLEQYSSGMRGMKDMLFGGDGDYIATEKEYLSGMIRNDLADNGVSLPQWLGGASLGQLAYDAVTTTANMFPAVLTAAVADFLLPGSGKILGNALVFSSSGGNAYIEARRMGFGEAQASGYAALVGGSEAGIGYLLGGIDKLGGKALNNVLGKVLPSVDNAMARIALNYGGKIIAEGNEERLQTILEPAFKKIALNIDADIDWEEAAYAWLLGALSAAGYGGGEIMADFGDIPGVKDQKSLGNALLSYDPVSLGKPGPDTAPAVPKISETPGKQPERQESLQPQTDTDAPYFTSDIWTNDLEGMWTDTGVDIMTEGDFDPDIGEDSILDLDTEPLRYEDYLRRYLDGDTDFSVLMKESEISQEAAPKSKEQIISELSTKIRTPGMTSGRAVIAAQEMYSEAEKIFGPDADITTEAYQPGQDPRKFLDGFRNAYLAGKLGDKAALENSSVAAYLTDSQRELAFAMGVQAAGMGSDYGDMRTIKGALQYLRETAQGKKSGGGQQALPPPLDMFPENDIMDKTRNRQKRHFWNIMSRQKGIPQDYLRVLTERFDKGTDLGKKVFLKYVTSDSVADYAENGKNHLSKGDRRIHLNAQKDMNDPRGHGTRFFHEHGHFIDLFAVEGEWKKRVSTRNNTFSQLIQSDFEMVCRKLIQQGAQGQKNAYEMLSDKIKGHNMHAVSDIIGGLTRNECGGNYKHENAYWEKPGLLARETFAHMFEALFDEKKYALFQEYFPNAFDEFIRMLEEIL